MDVIDFYFDIPTEQRDDFMAQFSDFRCWVEGDDDDLWVQGHPAMSEEFIKVGIPFTEIHSDETYDYHYHHSFKNGVHSETEEVIRHG